MWPTARCWLQRSEVQNKGRQGASQWGWILGDVRAAVRTRDRRSADGNSPGRLAALVRSAKRTRAQPNNGTGYEGKEGACSSLRLIDSTDGLFLGRRRTCASVCALCYNHLGQVTVVYWATRGEPLFSGLSNGLTWFGVSVLFFFIYMRKLIIYTTYPWIEVGLPLGSRAVIFWFFLFFAHI